MFIQYPPEFSAANVEPTYQIVTRGGVQGFKCLVCQRISFNVNDILNRYCGCCHRFHTEPESLPDPSHLPHLLNGCS